MKKENRLLTIDGETLMSQSLTPLNSVVDTLLSQGLHILAGSPKVAGILGHSQPSTTLDIYTHAFDKNKKATSAELQGMLEI